MGGDGVVTRLRKAARRIILPCVAIFREPSSSSSTISSHANQVEAQSTERNDENQDATTLAEKSICAICLESLVEKNAGGSKNKGGGEEMTIFKAQCCHCFHCSCIASNIRHGNLTCPICRAPWSNLPRNLNLLPNFRASDPILQILDESIATSRLIRRSSLRATRYDDDDPIDTTMLTEQAHPTLQFTLMPSQISSLRRFYQFTSSSLSSLHQNTPNDLQRVHLCVKLSPQPPVDLVLVVSPSGHMRRLKQALALAVFALRPPDRLAIVTNFSTANRAFPLRRMTSRGKQMALQVIDRLSYPSGTNSDEAIQKGVKILEDRMHCNPGALILQLSDSPIRGQPSENLSGIPIHRFHIGLSGFLMHDFEDYLTRLLGGAIENVEVKIGQCDRVVRIGELKGGEEKRIPLDVKAECGLLVVGYSYSECGSGGAPKTGEAVAGFEEKAERCRSQPEDREKDLRVRGRRSCAERWDHLDPFLARRWAKHLHACKA